MADVEIFWILSSKIEGIANTYNPISSEFLSCSSKWLIFIFMSLKVQKKSKHSKY